MGNDIFSENDVLSGAVAQIGSRLPPSWRVVRRKAGAAADLKGPRGESACLTLEAKRAIDPREVTQLVNGEKPLKGCTPVLASPFLNPRARDLLRKADWGYVDLTGNVLLRIERPALFIQTEGAGKNPWPEKRAVASLKGPVAGRIIRALCDAKPPIGVRALAAQAEATPGYLSRVLDFLNREALIRQSTKGSQGAPRRGTVTEADWKGLLRRWAEDYALLRSNRISSFLAPRGLPDLLDKLRRSGLRYALTASFGASKLAPVAPPKLLICYVDQREAVAGSLDLLPAETGANVILAEPFDPVVYKKTWERDGLVFAAQPQIVADLLTSPGRGPEEAEALIAWMEQNPHAWRA